MPFSATVTGRGPWTVIRFDGEIDLVCAAEAQDTIKREVARGARRIVLDLADLRFLDTSGASAILQMREKAEQIGVDILVADTSALERRSPLD